MVTKLNCATSALSIVLLTTHCTHAFGQEARTGGYKLEKIGGLLFATVEYGNKQLQFLVDSGSACHSLCASHAPSGSMLVADSLLPSGTKFQCRIGPFEHQSNDPVRVVDFTHLGRYFGCTIDGVLGMPFLRDKALSICKDAAYVLPVDNPLPKFDNEYSIRTKCGMPYLPFKALPALDSEIGDLEEWALIDSGSFRAIDLEYQGFETLKTNERFHLALKPAKSFVDGGRSPKVQTTRWGTFLPSLDSNASLQIHESDLTAIGLPMLEAMSIYIDFEVGKCYTGCSVSEFSSE